MRIAVYIALLACLVVGAAQAASVPLSEPSISRAELDALRHKIEAKLDHPLKPGEYAVLPLSELGDLASQASQKDMFLFGQEPSKSSDPTVQGVFWWFFSNGGPGNLLVETVRITRGFLFWQWTFNVNIPPGFFVYYIVPGPNWLATWCRVLYTPAVPWKAVNQLIPSNFGVGGFRWWWKRILWFPPPGPARVFVFGAFSDYCDAEFDTTGVCTGNAPDSVQVTHDSNVVPAANTFGVAVLSALMLAAGVLLVRRRRTHGA